MGGTAMVFRSGSIASIWKDLKQQQQRLASKKTKDLREADRSRKNIPIPTAVNIREGRSVLPISRLREMFTCRNAVFDKLYLL